MSKNKYKDTLLIPKNTFPMQGNLPELDKKIINYWKENNIYEKIIENKLTEEREIHYGPPFTNGSLHIGHSLNIILKDFVGRFTLMKTTPNKIGNKFRLITGHDCHGLPIETKVLESVDQSDSKNFIKSCQEYSKQWIKVQQKNFEDMGILKDKEYYATMNSIPEIYEVFSDLILKNKIYIDRKPMMWCIKLQCVVPDIDVEYKLKKTNSVYLKVKIHSSKDRDLENQFICIWTTTPWTLIDNQAIALNKNIDYLLVQLENQERILIGKKLLENLREKIEIIKVIKEFSGEKLLNSELKYCHFFKKEGNFPVIHSDHVVETDGTGFVHMAPAHGLEDFEICKKNSIEIEDSVEKDGYYKEQSLLKGFHIFKNEKEIILKLKENNNLINEEIIEHKYPYFSRSKMPIVFISNLQVFMKLDIDLKEAENKIGKIRFFPPKIKEQLIEMIKKRKEWCLSRNRLYGTPLAVFYHKKTKKILINKEIQEKILKQMKIDPIYFMNKSSIEILGDLKEDYEPFIGVLDCWFDSACVGKIMSKYYKEEKEKFRKAFAYIEGKDQVRGWFQSPLWIYSLLTDHLPYENVISHGFILAESSHSRGEKMSKSKNNFISLEETIKKGNEILRLMFAKSDYSDDVVISKKSFEEASINYRKFRNVLRYLVEVQDQNNNISINLKPLELGVLSKLKSSFKEYKFYGEKFEFTNAYKVLRDFVEYVSSNYLNSRKDILYCNSLEDQERKNVVYTCKMLLKGISLMATIFLPITTEEIFLHCKNYNLKLFKKENDSIHQEDFSFFDQLSYSNYEKIIEEIEKNLDFFKVKTNELKENKQIKRNSDLKVFIKKDIIKDFPIEELESILEGAVVVVSSENRVEINYDESCERCHKKINRNLCLRCSKVVKA